MPVEKPAGFAKNISDGKTSLYFRSHSYSDLDNRLLFLQPGSISAYFTAACTYNPDY